MKPWIALTVTVLLILPGVPAGAQPQGELRVAIPWTPENLDPTMNLSSIRATVGVSIFDSLVGRDADQRIVPQLAESWKLLDDNTWQLRLRRGVIFHGAPWTRRGAGRSTAIWHGPCWTTRRGSSSSSRWTSTLRATV